MATDSQGRPLSDDGQWAWNGTEWVPAAAGAEAPQSSSAEADPGATMIAPSPLASGGAPAAGQQPAYGGTPGYGAAPAGPAAPAYGAPGGPAASYGVPPQQPRSKKPIILLAVIGVLVIAGVVVALVLTLGSAKSTAAPSGAFTCTTPGATGTGTLTFDDKKYEASNSAGGTWTQDGKKITFHGGDFNNASGTFDSGKKTFTFTLQSKTYNCMQKK